MNILYFYQYFGTPQGGWSTRVYELTRRWVEDGHKVTVITSPYDKSDVQATGLIYKYQVEGINVIVINFKQSNKHSLLYRIFTFLMFSLISIFYSLKLRCDIVITSSGPITIGLPGLIAHYIRRKPLVFEVRDLWPEGAIALGLLNNKTIQKVAYWFEKRCYNASSAIVACSKGMAQSIIDRFQHPSVHVIPNASDNDLFGKSYNLDFELPNWAKNKNIFMYTGSLGLMDNCEQIIDAGIELFKRGDKQNIIVFLGEGKEKQFLEEKVKKHQLDNVFFLGLVSKMEVIEWLYRATSALLVFKPIDVLNTSSPNKMFDAFASKQPIIQTTQGWIKELIEKEHCGVNIQPNNPIQFADAIQKLGYDKVYRDTLSENAKNVALSYFDRGKLAYKMLDILKEASKK